MDHYFDMCEEHIRRSTVLDVGCGEGYVARQLVNMGAAKVVGVDSGSAMVKAVSSHPEKKNSK